MPGVLTVAEDALRATLPLGWTEYVRDDGATMYVSRGAAHLVHPLDRGFCRRMKQRKAKYVANKHSDRRALKGVFKRWSGYVMLTGQSRHRRRAMKIVLQRWQNLDRRRYFVAWLEFIPRWGNTALLELQKQAMARFTAFRAKVGFDAWIEWTAELRRLAGLNAHERGTMQDHVNKGQSCWFAIR